MKLSTLAIWCFASISFVSAATLSIVPSANGGVSVGIEAAQARIGRPLTPVSVAGVARRTTRRAVVGGAVVVVSLDDSALTVGELAVGVPGAQPINAKTMPTVLASLIESPVLLPGSSVPGLPVAPHEQP